MEAYAALSTGKLKLKGEKKSKKSKKHSKKRKNDESEIDQAKVDEQSHGGAWCIDSLDQIIGSVAIEIQEQVYIHGLDNGLFVMGPEHKFGQPPSPPEILTAIRIDDKHIAFKSGYGKYLSVNTAGLLIGRSDAISPREYFQVELDYDYDGRKTYIKACNDGYISVNSDGDIVSVLNKKSESSLTLRSVSDKSAKKIDKSVPEEERVEDLRNVEINYVRKFQKFQDKKLRLNEGDVKELAEAKTSGELHEKLLDRREKMKSDRYCK